MLSAVVEAIEEFQMIENGDRIVVGVSGGADSVALLLQLAEYRKTKDYTLQVFHLNHMIRDDADSDEEFVRDLCNRLNIPFFSAKENVTELAQTWHMSTEEAGRKIRYEKMRALNVNKIAVGHHEDDLAETVLLNMCRGTGIHGMVGIAPVQDDIIRPLIYLSRKDIEDYLNEIGQEYCTDSTNSSTDYTRNKLRLDVIPQLSNNVNEKTVRHIAAMAGDMYEVEEFIEDEADRKYKECLISEEGGEIKISLSKFKALKPLIIREIILKIMEKLTPRRKDISRVHVDMIVGICYADGEKKLDLPYGLEVRKSYEELAFRVETGIVEKTKETIIKVPSITRGEGWTLELGKNRFLTMRVMSAKGKLDIPNNTYTKWFDYDKIDWSKLCLRHRQAGDYLVINSKGSRKSLQDYMVDEKIERSKRDSVLLLADGDHILWVIGYRISEYYKISEESTRILEVEITEQ